MRGIMVFGAAGSGTSTLGKEIARLLGFIHIETDDLEFKKTDPPFIQKYAREIVWRR
ncbi:MAG: hypothetical protein FWE34_07295 [Defluviitaleaceae bacterium]|nr:hypothetical protein [Defluviitaleaceae bacterium]